MKRKASAAFFTLYFSWKQERMQINLSCRHGPRVEETGATMTPGTSRGCMHPIAVSPFKMDTRGGTNQLVHPGVCAQQLSQGFSPHFTSIVPQSGTSMGEIILAVSNWLSLELFLFYSRAEMISLGKNSLHNSAVVMATSIPPKYKIQTNTFSSIEAIRPHLTTLLPARLPPIGSEST